jgi:nitrite reductase (NADH) small subunit
MVGPGVAHTKGERGMKERIGSLADLDEAGRLTGSVGGREVTVLRIGETLVAHENRCPHMGGPVCEGKIFRRVEAGIEDGAVVEHFSSDQAVINCPWHGMEFDLLTGVCHADPRYRLRTYDVGVEGGDVLVYG